MKRGILLAAVAGALVAAMLTDREVPGTPTVLADREVPGVPTVLTDRDASATKESTVAAPAPARSACDKASAALSPRQRLAQLLMIGVPGNVTAATKLVRDHQVGGIFVHADPTNLLTSGRLHQVRSAAKVPLTVAIDEEGGRVQTVDPLAGTIPSARTMAATLSPEQVKAIASARGKFLSGAGVTMNFAPVLDVSSKPDQTVIGDRSFSADPQTVQRYASAFATGLSATGVLPVLKHFPGHGNADADSHRGTAVTPPLRQLEAKDLVPYQALGDYGPAAVMLGHLVVPGLTGSEPATLSPAAYRLLRDRYHFTGVAITDDLGSMRAVSDRYDLPEAVLRAISAGADVALWSSGARVGEVVDRLERATRSGELPAERLQDALRHVLASKGICEHR